MPVSQFLITRFAEIYFNRSIFYSLRVFSLVLFSIVALVRLLCRINRSLTVNGTSVLYSGVCRPFGRDFVQLLEAEFRYNLERQQKPTRIRLGVCL